MLSKIALGLLLVLCAGCSHRGIPPASPPPEPSTVAAPPPPPPPPRPDAKKPIRPPTPPMADEQVAQAKPPAPSEAGSRPAPTASAASGSGTATHHARQTIEAPANTPLVAQAAPAPEDHINSWFNQLKQGAIEYNVPQRMVWNVASTVSVVIHGYQAPKTSALSQATGSGTLKVSDRMKVRLLCVENPDEFTIVDEDGAGDTRFVPMDSTTIWRWQVTPKFPAKGQKLTIQAWALYPGQDDKYQEELPVYTATLDVNAAIVSNAVRGFWDDPGNWVKYMLPGGAGFLFLAGIATWLMKRFRKSSDTVK